MFEGLCLPGAVKVKHGIRSTVVMVAMSNTFTFVSLLSRSTLLFHPGMLQSPQKEGLAIEAPSCFWVALAMSNHMRRHYIRLLKQRSPKPLTSNNDSNTVKALLAHFRHAVATKGSSQKVPVKQHSEQIWLIYILYPLYYRKQVSWALGECDGKEEWLRWDI